MNRPLLALTMAAAVAAAGCDRLHLSQIRPTYPRGVVAPGSVPRFIAPPIDTALPAPIRATLKNGVKVLLYPDHELPLVTVTAKFRGGSAWDPAGKEGLASLTAASLRSGGTRGLTPDRFDEALDRIAAEAGMGFDDDSGSGSLSVLAEDLPEGLGLFFDMLATPRFDGARLATARARMIEGLRREDDQPPAIAQRELMKRIYEGSPYGRSATPASVKRIGRDDVVALHRRFFAPENLMLAVAGDVTEESILPLLEKTFGAWKARGQKPPVPKVTEAYPFELSLWDKKVPQAVIRLGHLGVTRTDPDYFPLRVMDEILGGNGFSSRLTQEIRVRRGLAYSVWSYYIGGRWAPGRFLAGTETKTATAVEALTIMRGQIARIRDERVSAEELRVAKESIVNSFVFIADTQAHMADQQLTADFYGYPAGYLDTYREKIEAVTAADVLRVAQTHLHPDGLRIVVVGDADALARPLADAFGPVRRIGPAKR